MSRYLKNRVKEIERRVGREPLIRTILAAFADYDEELEGHDSIRAKLHLRPEPGICDLVSYRLKRGEPPRLKMPEVWGFTIHKPVENVLEGGEIAPPSTA